MSADTVVDYMVKTYGRETLPAFVAALGDLTGISACANINSPLERCIESVQCRIGSSSADSGTRQYQLCNRLPAINRDIGFAASMHFCA